MRAPTSKHFLDTHLRLIEDTARYAQQTLSAGVDSRAFKSAVITLPVLALATSTPPVTPPAPW